mmetsp:Transcript_11091/g.14606  ORF Transcript_11091/g.14606 Transcript_11091/m.14606 type:complete len:186 (-) Transcript_11091:27-584(-)
MQYRTTIPQGVKPGDILPVIVMGIVIHVRIPKGRAGEVFTFDVTRETWEAARNNPQPFEGTPRQADVVRPRRSLLSRVVNLFSCNIADTFGHWSFFSMALLLGVAIGLSILLGFICGVLSVTDRLESQPLSRTILQQQQPRYDKLPQFREPLENPQLDSINNNNENGNSEPINIQIEGNHETQEL